MTTGYEVFAETKARREREAQEFFASVIATPNPTEEQRMEQLRKAFFDPAPPRMRMVLDYRQMAFFAAIAEAQEVNTWMAQQESR